MLPTTNTRVAVINWELGIKKPLFYHHTFSSHVPSFLSNTLPGYNWSQTASLIEMVHGRMGWWQSPYDLLQDVLKITIWGWGWGDTCTTLRKFNERQATRLSCSQHDGLLYILISRNLYRVLLKVPVACIKVSNSLSHYNSYLGTSLGSPPVGRILDLVTHYCTYFTYDKSEKIEWIK